MRHDTRKGVLRAKADSEGRGQPAHNFLSKKKKKNPKNKKKKQKKNKQIRKISSIRLLNFINTREDQSYNT